MKDMLRSLQQASDASHERRKAQPRLQHLYSVTCKEGSEEPEVGDLLSVLEDMLRSFDDIFIVIDALDECTDKNDLVSRIEQLNQWDLSSLHVLLTSRKESPFLDIVPEDFQIDIGEAEDNNDIRIWLEDQLAPNAKLGRKFAKWRNVEKLNVPQKLMERSAKM